MSNNGYMILKEWEHEGMACAFGRGPYGITSGYVAVPKGHPLYRKDAPIVDKYVDVCSSITFSGKLDSDDQRRFWVGFHMDYRSVFDTTDDSQTNIRTDEEYIEETNWLAEQLAAMIVKRICPIRSNRYSDNVVGCSEERCAWWMGEGCAVAYMGGKCKSDLLHLDDGKSDER